MTTLYSYLAERVCCVTNSVHDPLSTLEANLSSISIHDAHSSAAPISGNVQAVPSIPARDYPLFQMDTWLLKHGGRQTGQLHADTPPNGFFIPGFGIDWLGVLEIPLEHRFHFAGERLVDDHGGDFEIQAE